MLKKRDYILPAASLFVFLALIFTYSRLQPVNDLVRGFVGATLYRPFYGVALFFHYFYETPLGALQTLVWGVVLFFAYKDSKGAIMLVSAVAVQSLVTNVTKVLTAIPRPPQEYFGVFYHTYAYPSGHTSTSLTFAIMLAYILCCRSRRRFGMIISFAYILFAVVTPYTRLFLDVHQILDIIGGWANGLFISSLAIMLGRISKRAGPG